MESGRSEFGSAQGLFLRCTMPNFKRELAIGAFDLLLAGSLFLFVRNTGAVLAWLLTICGISSLYQTIVQGYIGMDFQQDGLHLCVGKRELRFISKSQIRFVYLDNICPSKAYRFLTLADSPISRQQRYQDARRYHRRGFHPINAYQNPHILWMIPLTAKHLDEILKWFQDGGLEVLENAATFPMQDSKTVTYAEEVSVYSEPSWKLVVCLSGMVLGMFIGILGILVVQNIRFLWFVLVLSPVLILFGGFLYMGLFQFRIQAQLRTDGIHLTLGNREIRLIKREQLRFVYFEELPSRFGHLEKYVTFADAPVAEGIRAENTTWTHRKGLRPVNPFTDTHILWMMELDNKNVGMVRYWCQQGGIEILVDTLE